MQILCFNPSQATRRHSQICVACPTCQGKRIQYVSDVSARHSTEEDSAKRYKAQEMLFNASSAQDRSTSKASLVLAQFCRKLPKGSQRPGCTSLHRGCSSSSCLLGFKSPSVAIPRYPYLHILISATQVSCIAPHVLSSILQNASCHGV